MVTSKLSQSSSGKLHPFSNLFSLCWKRKEPNERLRLYRRFTFKELRTATNNFLLTSRIGADGYYTMFKGRIDYDLYPVAIKRFISEVRYEEYFGTEMELLSNLRHHHPNIISPIGYCLDGPDKFVVYEYMPRGTLADQLHSKDCSQPLPWKRRLQICIGVARGLECLHSGDPLIIHRNIKSSNILLNQNWVAKISDFVLSVSAPTSLLGPDSHISTEIAGTVGYVDPEYYRSGGFTMKSDVYSLGVVLFEVLSSRKPFDTTRSQVDLSRWARECTEDGRVDEIIDPRLKGEIAPDCLKTYVDLAYNCTNERGIQRPPIAAVVKRLELALLLQECIEADIPFSPSWLKSIVLPPKRSSPGVEFLGSNNSGNFESDSDILDLLRD